MDVTTLIMTLTGLLGILLVLVLVYIFARTPDPQPARSVEPVAKEKQPEVSRKPPPGVRTLEELEAVLRNRKSSKEELRSAAEAIAKHYGKIYATTFNRYTRIIMSLCRHPQTDKNIVVEFDKSLRKQNPGMRHELDMALQKGLNSRG